MTKEPSKDEKIGFHKGALSTLAKERMELVKIIQVTEQLMKAHMDELKKLGIDLEKEAKKAMKNKEKLDDKIA